MDVRLSDEGVTEPQTGISGLPVLHAEAIDSRELTRVAGYEGQITGKGLPGDEGVVCTDRDATGLQVGADFAGAKGVIAAATVCGIMNPIPMK